MTETLPLTITELTACCEPIAKEPISAENAEQLAAKLKAIADPARLRLISLLAASKDSEACVHDLTGLMDLTQGTVSHHLKVLRDAGIVAADKRGTWVHYSVVQGALAELSSFLD
ncbi:MAG: transcriptional regulator [Actinobacteria bacterium HGW-Actinobacteria-4]|nr:MAG: transcriptional regulator [Actinobacteria bacterium HGW-Actinobacteria-4]